MAGREEYGMGPNDVLDRRFDGYLRDSKHFAQDSIIPMKLYCNNKACDKYYKKEHQYLGSCFLIKELNEDKEYLYFATAAHNLYCTFCKNYRWVKPILKWTAGQRQSDDFLLDEEDRGVSKSSFYGWMKVSDGYIQGISDMKSSKECYPFDYGILAVKIAGIDHAESYATKMRRRLGMFAAPPERHDLVKLAYLCGYPGEVCNQSKDVPPKGVPRGALEYMGPEKTVEDYYKWKVQGGKFWMSPGRSHPGEEATGLKPSVRKANERQTAALYPLPQRHEMATCKEQDSPLNKERLYRHYIDSSEGQSGSPVYLCEPDDDGEQCVAMGIHVGVWYGDKGEEKSMGFNVAVRLHGHVLHEMKSWVSDANNKATDQSDPLPDVDTLDGTEDFKLVCQPPTFFGSNMEQQGAGAAAQADPPSQERHVNPWQSTEYKSNYDRLIKRMNPTEVLAHMEVLQLIGYYEKEAIKGMNLRTERNEAILTRLSVVSKHFGKFREMLRRYSDCKKIAEEMDLVGPDPETDDDCKAARKLLEVKTSGP